MENQHQKIKGYRELSQAEIDLMNEIKNKGEELRALVAKINSVIERPLPAVEDGAEMVVGTSVAVEREADDPMFWLRWADGAFRSGVMYAVRAVAQPTSY